MDDLLWSDDEIVRELFNRAMPVMHLGLEEAYTFHQKDLVIEEIRGIADEIERSKEWLEI